MKCVSFVFSMQSEFSRGRVVQTVATHSRMWAHGVRFVDDQESAPEHRRHDGPGQPRRHRCKGIVEQECVGNASAVVAGEPDLVHAVVEADISVFRHDLAQPGEGALRESPLW